MTKGKHVTPPGAIEGRLGENCSVGHFVVVGGKALVGEGSILHHHVVVGAGARIGRGCVLHPRVVVADGVVLDDGVEVMPSAVLGRDPKAAGAAVRRWAPTRSWGQGRSFILAWRWASA